MNLRPYQQRCIEGILKFLADYWSTLVEMATGGGKTVVFAHLITHFPGRVLVLAHRRELVQQAADKIFRVTGIRPEIEMGQQWASTGRGLLGSSRVVVSSIQTQNSGARGAGRMSRLNPMDFDLVIIDECHHSTSSSYKAVIEYYRGGNPKIKIVGFTATPDRADGKALGQVFESVAFQYPLRTAIDDGWLVTILNQAVYVQSLDFSNVRKSGDDFNSGDLDQVMEQEQNLHGIATPTFEICGRRQTLIFAKSRQQAKRLAEILNRHEPGCAAFVDCDTPEEDRRILFDDFSKGKFRFLVNVGIATEGTDIPSVEIVVMARPTMSRALYAQMCGRGTRPLPGIVDLYDTPEARRAAIAASAKPHMTVLDFVGNTGRHDLCGVADILGGEFSEEARELVKKERAKGEMLPGDVIEQLKQAEARILKEQQDREEQEKRRHIKATATYSTSLSDPFNVLDIVPRQAPPGLQRTHNLSAKQVAFLESSGIKADGLTMNKASQLIGELMQRRATGKCSFKQARILKQHGHSTDVSFAEASKLIDAIAKNGWKRPKTEATV